MHSTLTVIGTVRPTDPGFAIELREVYRPGLLGLGGFSHATIYWLADRQEAPKSDPDMVMPSPYTASEEDIGVFATRSPERPSPVCASVVAVSAVDTAKGLVLTPFIDALPATPVIDIKPYFPASDRVRSAVIPDHFAHWPTCLEDSDGFDWQDEFTY